MTALAPTSTAPPLQTTYGLTASKPTSLVDSALFLLSTSTCLKNLKEALLEENLSVEVKSFITSLLSEASSSLSNLSSLNLPSELYFKDQGKRKTEELHTLLSYLEWIFAKEEFRNEDLQDVESLPNTLTKSLQEKIDPTDVKMLKMLDKLLIDLNLPAEHDLDKIVEAVSSHIELIKSELLDKDKFYQTKTYLLWELSRHFVAHSHDDSSSTFERILKSYQKSHLEEMKGINVSQLQTAYWTMSQVVTFFQDSMRFYRYDLMNQASIGLFDLAIPYTFSSKSYTLYLNLTSTKKENFRVLYTMQTVDNFAIRQGPFANLYQSNVIYEYTTVSEIIKGLHKTNPKYLFGIEPADFDFIAVCYDSSQGVYRFLRKGDSISTISNCQDSNHLSIFNHSSQEVEKDEVLKVLFCYTPTPNADYHCRSFELYCDVGGEGTINDLCTYLAQCIYSNKSKAEDIFNRLVFSAKMNLNSDKRRKDAVAASKEFGFGLDTPLKSVMEKIWISSALTQKNALKPSRDMIDISCFMLNEGKQEITFEHARYDNSESISLMPTASKIINYLLRLDEERQLFFFKTPESGSMFHGRDLNYYLPNELFVNTQKLSHMMKLDEDLDLYHLKSKSSDRDIIHEQYNLRGGIFTHKDVDGISMSRPFTVHNEQKDGKRRFYAVFSGGVQKEINLQLEGSSIDFLYFERKTLISH